MADRRGRAIAPLLAALKKTLVKKACAEGACGYGGSGLQECHDNNAYQAADMVEDRGCLRTRRMFEIIASGRFWGADRRHNAGYWDIPTCPMCGAAATIDWHMLWECDLSSVRPLPETIAKSPPPPPPHPYRGGARRSG